MLPVICSKHVYVLVMPELALLAAPANSFGFAGMCFLLRPCFQTAPIIICQDPI